MSSRTKFRTSRLALVAALTVAAGTGLVRADFFIAYSGAVEDRTAVAHHPTSGEFLVAHLTDGIVPSTRELEVRRVDATGSVLSVVRPFGVGTVAAVGRPAVAYANGSDRFLVAVTENLGGFNRVIARLLDNQGQPIAGSTTPLFEDTASAFVEGGGTSSLVVTYNSILNEFLVTWQRLSGGSNGVWAQVVRPDGTHDAPTRLSDHGSNGILSHAVAFAPIPTTPTGGRYLYAVSSGNVVLRMLDADGVPILVSGDAGSGGTPYSPIIPFDWGDPQGKTADPAIAWGTIQGRDRILVVWSDEDNCRPSVSSCPDPPGPDQWAGVWAGYVDPTRLSYSFDDGPDNTPFPVSKIGVHVANRYEYRPRVAYNTSAERFYVAWREYPVDDPGSSDETRSHIRAGHVDYFVADGLAGTSLVPLPHDNVVVSTVGGICVPGQPCRSEEDPTFPDVTAASGFAGLVAWHQSYPPNPADLDVWGDFVSPPPPANDGWWSSISVTGFSATVEGTLVGATFEAGMLVECGNSDGEPDVWYRYFAPANGTLRVNSCGTHDMFVVDRGIDTVLSFHDPAGAPLPDPGDCNDDWPFGVDPVACVGLDDGAARDSALVRPVLAGQELLVRVSRYRGTTGGPFVLHFGLEVTGAGAVPDGRFVPGTPLSVGKGTGGDIVLAWGPSCAATDTDYEVYAGWIGDFASHEPLACSTSGSTAAVFDPGPGDRYFLVVPRGAGFEGSYGRNASGLERPPSAAACLSQAITTTCP